jgi:hypothetical protein
MQVFLWSGMFLLFSIGGSIVGLAGLIGFPIAPDIHAGIAAVAAIIVVSGIALVLFTPSAPASAPIEAPAA